MKRSILIVLAVMAVVGLVIVYGCSSDSSSPTGQTVVTPPNAGYEQVNGLLNVSGVDYSYEQLSLSLYLMGYLAGDKKALPLLKPLGPESDDMDVNVVNHEYTNNWHIFTISATIIRDSYGESEVKDTIIVEGTDSLRFHGPDGYVELPNQELDLINVRSHYEAHLGGEGYSAETKTISGFNLTVDFPYSLIINGSSDDSVAAIGGIYVNDGLNSTCTFGMITHQTWDDIFINGDVIDGGGCPPSGSISLTSTITSECENPEVLDSVTVAGSWSMGVVFDDGIMTSTLTTGTTNWRQVDTCGVNFDVVLDEDLADCFEDEIGNVSMYGIQASVGLTYAATGLIDPSLPEMPPLIEGMLRGLPLNGEDDVDYTYSNGWHIISYAGCDTSEDLAKSAAIPIEEIITCITGVDSIKIYNNGSPMQEPNSNADSILARNHYVYIQTSNIGDDTMRFVGHDVVRFEGTPWDDPVSLTLNGTASDSVRMNGTQEDGSYCLIEVSSNVISNNVEFGTTALNSDDGCPDGGSISLSVNLASGCWMSENPFECPINGEWSVVHSFDGTEETAVYHYLGQELTVTNSCGGDAKTQPQPPYFFKLRHK